MTTPPPTIETTAQPLAQVHTDWLAVGVWEGEPLSGPAADADSATGGLVSRLVMTGDVTGKPFETVPVYAPPGLAASRLLVVGLGRRDAAGRLGLHDAAAAAAREVTGKKLGTLAFAVPPGAGAVSLPEALLAVGVGLSHGCHGPGIRKTTPSRFAPRIWPNN